MYLSTVRSNLPFLISTNGNVSSIGSVPEIVSFLLIIFYPYQKWSCCGVHRYHYHLFYPYYKLIVCNRKNNIYMVTRGNHALKKASNMWERVSATGA